MYRDKNFYKKYSRLVIDIYLDYGIHSFPIDEKQLCSKMGIKLVPYSILSGEELLLAHKKSKNGFYAPPTYESSAMIYYNDNLEEMICSGRIRYTIFHEIKHYANGDIENNEEIEDSAQYFAKYMMCPMPYLLVNQKKYKSIDSIINGFGVSVEVAEYLMSSLRNRIDKYGMQLFEDEIDLLECIKSNKNNGL